MKLGIIFILILLPLFCLFCKDQPILDKDKTFSIRGILALIVVIGHCAFYTSGEQINFDIFKGAGVWVCGVFFLLSGYGLWLQHDKIVKQSFLDYSKTRVCKILIDFLIIIGLFIILQCSTNSDDEFTAFKDIVYGSTDAFLPYSWFIIMLILFYFVLFYLLKLKKTILLIFIATIIIGFILYIMPWGAHWYMSLGGFPIGVLLAYYKNYITKNKIIALSVACLVLTVLNIKYSSNVFASFFTIPLLSIVIVYLSTNYSSYVYDKIRFLSKYAFYIYMFQGFYIKNLLLNSGFNDWLYVLSVIFLSVSSAVIYYYIKNYLLHLYNRF